MNNCIECGATIDDDNDILICDDCFGLVPFEPDEIDFADQYGESSLYAATADNPRDKTCPQCRTKNALTQRDIDAHHICDQCVSSNASAAGYD